MGPGNGPVAPFMAAAITGGWRARRGVAFKPYAAC